jgi:hypothetical protein
VSNKLKVMITNSGSAHFLFTPEGGRAAEAFSPFQPRLRKDSGILDTYSEDGCGRKIGSRY